MREWKIFDNKNFPSENDEVYQTACECLSFIIKLKKSELIHIFRLDDEEKELDENDIECAILKAFIDCNYLVNFLVYIL